MGAAPPLKSPGLPGASRPDGGPVGGLPGRARRACAGARPPPGPRPSHPIPRPSCRISSAWRRRFGSQAAAEGGRGGRRRRFRTGCFRPATSPGAARRRTPRSAHAHPGRAAAPGVHPVPAAGGGASAAGPRARSRQGRRPRPAGPGGSLGGRFGGEAAAARSPGPPDLVSAPGGPGGLAPRPPRPRRPARPAGGARHLSHARPRRQCRRPVGGCLPGRPALSARNVAGAARRRGPDGRGCRPARLRRPALETRGRRWSARCTRRRALGAGRDAKGTRASPRATPAEPGGPPEAEVRTRAGPRAGAQVSPGAGRAPGARGPGEAHGRAPGGWLCEGRGRGRGAAGGRGRGSGAGGK